MNRGTKLGIVIGGYVAAFAAGAVAARLYDERVSSLPYDTSGGMYAAGQTMFALAAFLVVALVPTLLALWFLRHHAGVWNGVAILSLGYAAAGLLAVLAPLVVRDARNPAVLLLGLLSLSQLLGMPLWSLAFLLFAVLAPTRPARRMLMVAIGLELAIGVCALEHWFGHAPPL